MSKRVLLIYCILVLLGALTGFINWTYATGYILGCLVAFLTFKIVEQFCDQILDMKVTRLNHFQLLMSYGLWAVVLLISALLPQYFNIFACAIGLFTVKIALVIDAAITHLTK